MLIPLSRAAQSGVRISRREQTFKVTLRTYHPQLVSNKNNGGYRRRLGDRLHYFCACSLLSKAQMNLSKAIGLVVHRQDALFRLFIQSKQSLDECELRRRPVYEQGRNDA